MLMPTSLPIQTEVLRIRYATTKAEVGRRTELLQCFSQVHLLKLENQCDMASVVQMHHHSHTVLPVDEIIVLLQQLVKYIHQDIECVHISN